MPEFSSLKKRRWTPLYAAPLLAGLSALPAAADIRDQVEAQATRCAVIGDDRQWLDCYYGAAQPVRAELGLRAATETQLKLAMSPPAGASTPESQTVRNAVLRNAFGCGMDPDRKSWLTCFYAAAEPMRAHLGLAPAIAQAATMAKSQAPPTPAFGPPERRKPASEPFERVTAHMAAYSFDKSGFFTVTLDNGQAWRQLSSDDNVAHWHASPGKYLVKISKGFWGSHNLEVANSPGLYKVRRIK